MAYDGLNRVYKVFNAKELIDGESYTKQMPLDCNVAYVSIVVNEVNNLTLIKSKTKPVTPGKIAGYSAACFCTTVLGIFLVNICCANLFGGVFRESFMLQGDSVWLTVGMAIAAALINLVFVILAIGKNNRWKLRRGEE